MTNFKCFQGGSAVPCTSSNCFNIASAWRWCMFEPCQNRIFTLESQQIWELWVGIHFSLYLLARARTYCVKINMAVYTVEHVHTWLVICTACISPATLKFRLDFFALQTSFVHSTAKATHNLSKVFSETDKNPGRALNSIMITMLIHMN